MFSKYRILLLLSFWTTICQGQLFINEIQASNITTLFDPRGNYLEWVEIYNPGNQAVDLTGYYLSDDPANPAYSRIKYGPVVGGGSYAIVWLGHDGYKISEEIKLDMDGGVICLSGPDGQLLDVVNYQEQYLDISYGRSRVDFFNWEYYDAPTPGKANTSTGLSNALFAGKVEFSLLAGLYDGPQTLELSKGSSGGMIRYSDDGSWPTATSKIYDAPIQISKTTIIRARLFEENKLPGEVSTHTFLMGVQGDLPVVSLTTDRENFFSDNYGLYVEGTNGTTGYCLEYPVNWNNDWERPVNFEYFSREGVQEINQLVGARIHGGCSRMFSVKSLALMARKRYGDNSLDYPFFHSKGSGEFKSLVLRNSGNDAATTLFRDGFMHSLLHDRMDVDLVGYEPAIVFINGTYWGIQNIREKINEHYPASNYNLDAEKIDMLEKLAYLDGVTVSGSVTHYADLMDFVFNNDLNVAENYDYVSTQMDINEFMNYFITHIYFQNEDWPHNNIKYWRPQHEGGKWRWILYDTDLGWGLSPRTGNCLEWATRDHGSTRLFRALLEADSFRYEFIQRLAGHINTTFHPETVAAIYDSIKGLTEDEIIRHRERWNKPELDKFILHTETIMPEFTMDRPDVVRAQLKTKFGLSGMYTLSCSVNDPERGYIKTSEVTLPPDFSGSYFKDIPLRIVAVPRSGFTFSHWEGASDSNRETIYLNSSNDVALTAVFKTDTPMSKVFLNEVCASNKSHIRDEYGQLEDWIEVYNDNEFEVNLAGWFLSDSSGFQTQYQIPHGFPEITTVKAKSYLLFWCDNDSRQGPLHTNFKLNKEGESISLVQKIDQSYICVDSLRYASLPSDLTFARLRDSGPFEIMSPTPNASNTPGVPREIYINEYLAKNVCDMVDESQESDDWIEIYNPTSDTLDLGGLYFTDSLDDRLKHRIPTGNPSTKIAPYAYKVLWADNQPEQGPLHLGFRLNSKHEQIGIYQLNYGYLDSLTYHHPHGALASGRYPDGMGQMQVTLSTPGASNELPYRDRLFINEYMASNASFLCDEFGEYNDWIEIYNDNDFPVDIGGLYLTDSLANPAMYRIPTCKADSTTIPAKGHVILWADNQEEQGVRHLGFKLDADGEEIGLVASDGREFIDSLSYTDLSSGLSMGRFPDGASFLRILTSTPGSENRMRPSGNLQLSEIVASGNETYFDQAGESDDWIEIYNGNAFEVDIGGFYITDSIGHMTKYRIPAYHPDSTTISPGGYLILWADNQPEQGITHLDFRLSGGGEQLALVNPEGTAYLDSLTFPNQYKHFSYSRLAGSEVWKSIPPTPGSINLVPEMEGIIINEFMASNTSYADENGSLNDWIELYNTNEFPVNIGGLYITDSLGNPAKYRIPSHSPELTTIQAKDYYILVADNKEVDEVHHVNFKLSRSGEQLALVHYDQETVLDSVTYAGQYRNASLSWLSPYQQWHSITPTPGGPNELPDFSQLVINEVMGSNKTTYYDGYSEYDDWIELYNGGSEPLDIGGLFMSDSLNDPFLHRISSEYPDSTTIPAGGYKIIWADNSEEQGILHLGFKISKTGEAIGLFDFMGEVIDSVSYPFISPNLSWSRSLDGESDWTICHSPTPMMTNLTTDIQDEFSASSRLEIYPNPATDRTYFKVALEDGSDIIIEIMDGNGKLVSVLKQAAESSGTTFIEWNCRDGMGNTLPSGLYVCRIRTKTFVDIRKLILR
jgi:hypothetical protein